MLALRFYGTVLTYPKSQRVPHSPRFLLVRCRHPMTSIANPILVEPHDAYSGYSGGVGGSTVRSTTWAGLTAWGEIQDCESGAGSQRERQPDRSRDPGPPIRSMGGLKPQI